MHMNQSRKKCRSKAYKDQVAQKVCDKALLASSWSGGCLWQIGFEDVSRCSKGSWISFHFPSRFIPVKIHKPWKRDQTCRAEDLHTLCDSEEIVSEGNIVCLATTLAIVSTLPLHVWDARIHFESSCWPTFGRPSGLTGSGFSDQVCKNY